MMSEEQHHHHHHLHHHFNDFPAANPSPMTIVAHDPFAGGTPSGGWAGESSYFRPQSLSLSLCNPPQLSPFQPPSHHPFHIKTSKYLLPAQELLSEFCSLGAGLNSVKRKHHKTHEESSPCLYSMEHIELQKRKANLISMLEEVDRRYKRYCEQMKAVVAAFEEVAGDGAAKTYSSLASKAMSRHFRCLRDGIADQIRATRRAMGESDVSTIPGLSRGETPRLRILDQSLRQHKAFQQSALVDGHPWRPQRGLPERSVSILRAWLFEHFLHPYPTDMDKHILARQTGLSRSQVSNWFINARVRLWKPMVEEMYLEEMKDGENSSRSPHASLMHGGSNDSHPSSSLNPNPDLNALSQRAEPKVELTHLHLEDPHSFSAIFSGMDAHFGAYHGPELALGRQPHERQRFFVRETVGNEQFTEGEGQSIPYRNYVGAQLLHDLAG